MSKLPCIATAVRLGELAYGVHVAHVRFSDHASGWTNPGMMMKPDDDRVVPLIPEEHMLQHRGDERAYWRDLEIWPPDLCMALRDAYLGNGRGTAVILRFAQIARRKLNADSQLRRHD